MSVRFWPMEAGRILTSPFGPRGGGFHRGLDIGWPGGSANLPVYAMQAGTVVHAGAASGFGGPDPAGWLVIKHADGTSTVYGHIIREVSNGARVEAGQRIARINPDQRTNGGVAPHLHAEVHPGNWAAGSQINPVPWLHGALDPNTPQNTGGTPVTDGSLIGKTLIDYAAGVPTARGIRNAGYLGAVRYVSPPRADSASWMKGKPLTRAEVNDFKANGLIMVSVWQYGKRDFDRGYEGGKADAAAAQKIHEDAGGPQNAVIYAAVDAHPSQSEWDRLVEPYLKGWQDAIGKERLGVYCNRHDIDRCIKAGIGSYWWQHGWDGGTGTIASRRHPRAHLLQFEIDKLRVEGIGIDRNSIHAEKFGQWDWDASEDIKVVNPPEQPGAPAPTPPTPERSSQYPIRWADGLAYTSGRGEFLRIYIHTTENQDFITKAENVAAWQARSRTGSYHYLIDDEKILQCVSLKNTAWAVRNDNRVSVNIGLVMTSGAIPTWSGANPNVEHRPKSREQWLAHDKMLDMLAFLIGHIHKEVGIPIERVDIAGVGANRRGVSSHNNYTYGSQKLKGYKDGTHWDVPDTFPYTEVLTKAKGEAAAPPDPDRWPLPPDHYWGPLEGPQQSWSNLFGTEPQSSKDGLKRWQETLGIPATSVFDADTREAAMTMQKAHGWPITGNVWPGEWYGVIRDGWRLPERKDVTPVTPAHWPAINPGPAVSSTRDLGAVTGPGKTTSFRMEATDLGQMVRTPSGRIAALFGDTFRGPRVGDGDWRSPVLLFSDTTDLDKGLTWHSAAGNDPKYGAQLWHYDHNNPQFSTVLPADIITIGDTMYLWAMVNKGLGNVVWTEIWQSKDDGQTWQHTGHKTAANVHGGLLQMPTWELGDDGWVYLYSTGFQRDKPLILMRCRPEHITDPSRYVGWGFRDGKWAWGNPPTPVLPGKFGELCLRRIQGKWVLVYFDRANYRVDAMILNSPIDNLHRATKHTLIHGGRWGQESHTHMAQLYGPSIVPGSRLDGGFHLLVSQWNTGGYHGPPPQMAPRGTVPNGPAQDNPRNWPYWVRQVKVALSADVSGWEEPAPPAGEPAPEPEPIEPEPVKPDPEPEPAPEPEPEQPPEQTDPPQPPPQRPPPSHPIITDIATALSQILKAIFRRSRS